MIKVPKIVKFDFTVPNEVLDSIKKLDLLCRTMNLTRGHRMSPSALVVYKLQTVPKDVIEKYKLESNTNAYSIIEQFGLETEWLINSNEVNIIKDFLYKNFESPFGFRLHYLEHSLEDDGSAAGIVDVLGHSYPKVFIPVTNNDCEYTIIDKDGFKHKMIYEIGNCYIWDVRLPHFVTNHTQNNEGRLVAIFMVDPAKEKLLQIKGL